MDYKDKILKAVNEKLRTSYKRAYLPTCKNCGYILPNGSTLDICEKKWLCDINLNLDPKD